MFLREGEEVVKAQRSDFQKLLPKILGTFTLDGRSRTQFRIKNSKLQLGEQIKYILAKRAKTNGCFREKCLGRYYSQFSEC